MRDRLTCLKHTPTITSCKPVEERLRKTAENNVKKIRDYYNKKFKVTPHKIKVGDYVRIKLPMKQHTMDRTYSEPLKVIHIHRDICTLDNKRWHSNRLILVS